MQIKQAGNVQICTSGGGGCTSVDVGDSDVTTTTSTTTTTSANGPGGGGGGGGGGGSTSTRVTRTTSSSPLAQADSDLDILARRCGSNGDLIGYDEERAKDLQDFQDQLKKLRQRWKRAISLPSKPRCLILSIVCHKACVDLALGDEKGACHWQKLTSAFKNQNEFCAVMTKDDSSPRVDEFRKGLNDSQNTCQTYASKNVDSGAVCKAMIGNKNLRSGDEAR